jgi:hypothetical protein
VLSQPGRSRIIDVRSPEEYRCQLIVPPTLLMGKGVWRMLDGRSGTVHGESELDLEVAVEPTRTSPRLIDGGRNLSWTIDDRPSLSLRISCRCR